MADKKIMLIRVCKFILVVFPLLALTTALLQVFEKTNENQLVFAATAGDYFYDGTNPANVEDELTNTFFVVDTRLAHHGRSVRIMHASIDENGNKFHKKEKGQAISYKYSNKCMGDTNTGPKSCDDCLTVETNPYNQVDTLKKLIPVADVQNGKCAIKSTDGVSMLDPILSLAPTSTKYRPPIPTIGAMPTTRTLTMTVKHTTWVLCLLHISLFVCTCYICFATGLSKRQCFLFCMLVFVSMLAYSSRDVEMGALGSDGNLRQWTRTAILNEGDVYKSLDSATGITQSYEYKEFAYNDVATFFKECTTSAEGDKYKVIDKESCTKQVPAMTEGNFVDGSSYWVLTYVSYFITIFTFVVYYCIADGTANKAISNVDKAFENNNA